MISVAAFVLLAATPPPTPTPTPAPSVRVLLRGESTEQRPAASGGGSLSDVAKRIKLKLPTDQPRRLTNQSVGELSKGVELTTARPAGDSFPLDVGAGGPGQTSGNQQIWQQRYQEARSMVTFWEGEVRRLESDTAQLETQFYSVDDPAYRDGVVKPAWDKALSDLRAARQSLEEARSRPGQVLEDARRAGALPGWFRGLPDPTPPPAPAGAPDDSD